MYLNELEGGIPHCEIVLHSIHPWRVSLVHPMPVDGGCLGIQFVVNIYHYNGVLWYYQSWSWKPIVDRYYCSERVAVKLQLMCRQYHV